MKERLQKILAHAGIGSRRACEDLIRQGRVAVNGQTAHIGQKADPDRDSIAVDGEPVQTDASQVYVALHKPRGVLSHDAGSAQRRTVACDLVSLSNRLYPVGRLDLQSEGLLLLTNDGDLTYRLTHPRFGHEKEYRVLVKGQPSEATLEKWRNGVFLNGRTTAPADVSVLRREKKRAWLRVILREGRKRQIRRVAAMLGHPVRRLIRVRIGPVLLGKLKPGKWRHLTRQELKSLKKLTGSNE